MGMKYPNYLPIAIPSGLLSDENDFLVINVGKRSQKQIPEVYGVGDVGKVQERFMNPFSLLQLKYFMKAQ